MAEVIVAVLIGLAAVIVVAVAELVAIVGTVWLLARYRMGWLEAFADWLERQARDL